jgi:hypothetical protein
MKRKVFSTMLGFMLCAGMLATGCGKEESSDAVNIEVTESTVEQTEDDLTSQGVDQKSEANTVTDGDYVNIEHMTFYINGKEYVLGQTTLQELIDDGVPFESESLDNAANNIDKNTQSSGFKIELGEYWTAQVYVLNESDEGKPANELYVNEVYLPNHPDESQNILSFTFPLNMTEEQLRTNAGEPTDFSEYDDDDYTQHTLKYTQDGEKYYGDCGYKFEFTNGELKYITMTYLP